MSGPGGHGLGRSVSRLGEGSGQNANTPAGPLGGQRGRQITTAGPIQGHHTSPEGQFVWLRAAYICPPLPGVKAILFFDS